MPAANINDYWVRWLQSQIGSQSVSDGAVVLTATSANLVNAQGTATLAGAANKFTYITGFQCTASGATAGLAVTVTVTGITTPLNFTFTYPAGIAVPANPLIVNFPQPIPSSAQNTAIVVTLPASGAGGTNATVSAYGYQL